MAYQPTALLMTRPLDRAQGFVARLDAEVQALIRPHYAPLWRMERVAADLPGFDAAVFSSVNGVRFGPQALGRVAYCVGPATTKAAQRAGWQAMEAGQDADHLVQTLLDAPPKGQLLHLSGADTRGAIAERLKIAHCAVYAQIAQPMPEEARILLREEPVIVPLFSPAGAAHFADLAYGALDLHLAVISENAAAALPSDLRAICTIARAPNAKEMGAAIAKLAQKLQSG